MNVVIIGLGGIGSNLVRRLCRFFNYSKDIKATMTLIDGDLYEPKNYERQEFINMGNKAEVQCRELSRRFDNIQMQSVATYINEKNVNEIINEDQIIFLCVDNHKTRRIINERCKSLKNVTLISGGNELIDGNVQIYVRKEGKNLTPDICAYHPEITNAQDKLPEEMSCEELSQSVPQMYFTNVTVATFMCLAFRNAVLNGRLLKSEVYLDIDEMAADSKIRIVEQ